MAEPLGFPTRRFATPLDATIDVESLFCLGDPRLLRCWDELVLGPRSP